ADAIGPDHPNIIIDTLAYQYTRKPPLHVKPHKNVAVRLCSIECEFNRPLASSPYNATFVKDIEGWNAICKRLYIWDYVINYAHTIMPFPNLRVLRPNIRFFVRNGVKGIYEEADYYTRGGELAELRTYLMAKCLWNPDYDVDRAIDEFLPAYYGAAAAPIHRYLDEVHRLAVSDRHYHMPIYIGPTGPHLAAAALDRYDQWFDEAEAAVNDDPILLHRVQTARMPILYTRIAKGTRPVYQLTGHALTPTGAGDVGPLVERFEKIARAEGVSHISEGRSFDDWLGSVARGAREIPLLELTGGGLTALVAPRLGGRIYSLKRGEQELLQVVETKEGLDPTTGGYKEFSESGYQSPGWTEPYEVVKQSDTAVTLRSARLRNGLVFERTYELLADRPVLRVSSKLTNPAGGAKTARIRVHACFHLADAAQASLRVGAGEQKLAAGANKEAELWFRDRDRPAGVWTIIDPAAGVTVTDRFRAEQVELAYFNWNGPDHRANPELWSPERSLRAAESLLMEHEYEIGRP
ncbi:MAG: DUF4838 domain-containing protein, partial [Armatimonadetes bacterium]|nr:DUF4838 domain-containing protein [Armatimonadota bacterium]